ncbi:hypothetical protein ZIOFF_038730 [Zingiber officinale]|uniref:Uncharacterized protein n=1 Tax=Zingiber officinale TaxID=94328 RepID=A0A8J5G665_ZINOF|nr:hypothetical protein ZIOFF_038730 [Zingiber officinale]
MSPSMNIPHRPAGQRPATTPLPPPDLNNFHHGNPWFMGGAPVGSTRFGNYYTFSAAIGGLFPVLSFQVHGFPAATVAYGPGTGFPYGYGHAFQGGTMFMDFPGKFTMDNKLMSISRHCYFLLVLWLIVNRIPLN